MSESDEAAMTTRGHTLNHFSKPLPFGGRAELPGIPPARCASVG